MTLAKRLKVKLGCRMRGHYQAFVYKHTCGADALLLWRRGRAQRQTTHTLRRGEAAQFVARVAVRAEGACKGGVGARVLVGVGAARPDEVCAWGGGRARRWDWA
jgi:hypothetical protein